jgi:internalin A
MDYQSLLQLIDQAADEQWEELDLSGQDLAELPPQIGKLTQLERLILGKWDEEKQQWIGIGLKVLPSEIEQLTNLTKLTLSGNQLTEIPTCITKLSKLEILHLAKNQLAEVPPSIVNLINLKELFLWGNALHELPECIASLTNLTELNLSQNQITQIPECIASLTNLTELYLWQNQITQIPECIASLTNLTKLSLWQNQITQIPECIASLTNLTELSLNQNQITQIPECIASLTNLTKLSLWQNQITQIPECIASLTNLTKLSLNQNQITQIPECIASLTNLLTIGLGNNVIRELPRSLEILDKLSLLQLDRNPLSIPPETLRQGWGKDYNDPGDPKSILNYYFATREPNQTQTLYEVKLLLVGEGGAGKTSLANKLLNLDYQLKSEAEDISTKGIDILKWEFSGRDGNSYRISIWDFGGQEIYHQTHQFFLTERSLYLLVADSRKEDTDHYFWLKSIQLLSNNSPVLLIQNEKLNRICNLNFNQLRGEFYNLRDTYRVNLADNRGLDELQSAIQHELERLIPNGIPFPNKWLAVRYALANDGRNYLDYSEYQVTCRRHSIIIREEMNQLSQFLHDLGICLHFQKDPILCNRLILKPNWGTAAVYKILDNDTVKQNLGQFNDADLADIWAAPEYADIRDQLLQLMKEFRVCYEIPRRKGRYIAPHLLSPEAPRYDWQSDNNLTLGYRYTGFMPKGILTRFIVEMHQDIENVSEPELALVWRSGVVITDKAARAQITEHYQQREISIRVYGNRPRDLLTIINRKFQEIHDSFDDRLVYETLIPCNCPTCKTSQQPFTFPLNRLHQCIDRGRPTIECHESGNGVNVRGLIDGVIIENPNPPEWFEDGDGDREEFPGKPSRNPLGKRRRDRPQPPNVNVSVSVPIHNRNQQEQAVSNDKIWQGDRVEGDKFAGDKVAGNKMQIGTVHGDAVAGNKVVNSQNLAQAAQDIKALLDQLAIDYPAEDDFTRAGRAVGAIKNNPTLKQRVTNALKESGTTAVEKAIEAVTDNPAVSIVVAGVKGFIDAEGD